jgi:hypothetical protein
MLSPPAHRTKRDERGTASSCAALIFAVFDRANCPREKHRRPIPFCQVNPLLSLFLVACSSMARRAFGQLRLGFASLLGFQTSRLR